MQLAELHVPVISVLNFTILTPLILLLAANTFVAVFDFQRLLGYQSTNLSDMQGNIGNDLGLDCDCKLRLQSALTTVQYGLESLEHQDRGFESRLVSNVYSIIDYFVLWYVALSRPHIIIFHTISYYKGLVHF
jgi:hypothetical protein